jgi:hypothetical protein
MLTLDVYVTLKKGQIILDFLTDPVWLGVAAWSAVMLATLALIPQAVKLGRWLHKRRQQRFIPQTQSKKDRANYGLLLQKYEGYLDILSDLIVLRSQLERGPDEFTLELELEFVRTRDDVYHSLEKRSKREKEMGVSQLLEVLEERMVGTADLRNKRDELQVRQAEIENHPLFIKRRFSDD